MSEGLTLAKIKKAHDLMMQAGQASAARSRAVAEAMQSPQADAFVNRDRVQDRIQGAVLRFCRGRIGKTFHAEELLRYCRVLAPEIAPDSPSRILRLLRQSGRIEYALLNRRASEYTVMWVAPERA